MDVNTPLENTQLVAAMEALQRDPVAENEQVFLSLLQAARFLLLLQDAPAVPEEPGGAPEPGAQVRIPMLRDSGGRPLYIAFTDRGALGAFHRRETPRTLIVPFADLSRLALRAGADCAGVLLNPGTHRLFLARELLLYLDGQPVPHTMEAETQVLIGEPKEFPHALAQAVAAGLESTRTAQRAWLLYMVRENEPSYLVVVDFHGGGRDTVSRAVAAAARPHLPPGMFVDIVSYADAFGKRAAADKTPFYTRGERR